MKSLHLFIYLFIYLFSFSQTPVKWNIKYSPDKNKIVFNAIIDSNWHLYALDVPHPDKGPLPTIVEFEKQKNYLLKGKVFQEKPIIRYDKGFGINVAYYENQTSFYQKIKPLENSFEITGVVKYMACDHSQCLALDKVFIVKVNHQD
jgi:thiol:disulfide interchange protein DsbD